MLYLGGQRGVFSKVVLTSGMTSEGLGEMFEGDSADTCARKFPLMLMGDERTVQRAQTVSEDPHRRERNCLMFAFRLKNYHSLIMP